MAHPNKHTLKSLSLDSVQQLREMVRYSQEVVVEQHRYGQLVHVFPPRLPHGRVFRRSFLYLFHSLSTHTSSLFTP